MSELYCANCETEATHITSSGAPLCRTCATAYEWGQASADKPAPTEIDDDHFEGTRPTVTRATIETQRYPQ